MPGTAAASRRAWPWLLALLLAASAGADSRIEIFELSQRSAAELATIVQPLLGADEAVQASGFQLIVRARPETLEQVRDLVERLDRAPRQLLISVRQPSESRAVQRERSADVEADQDGARARVRIYDTESRSREAASQRIRVLEGNAAFIEAGQSVPVGERSVTVGPGGAVVHDTTRYRDVTSGFYVVARLAGDQVVLELSTRRDTLSRHGGGVVDTRRATTTVRGPIGEWIEVGGVGEQRRREGRGVLYRSGERSATSGRVELRVELADAPNPPAPPR